MSVANPLIGAIECERQHRQHVRRNNAEFRMTVAIHEAAHAVAGYPHGAWGKIEIPVANPVRGKARTAGVLIEHDVESCFAGLAIDEMMFGHGRFARHDFVAGMELLIKAYGHDEAQRKAPPLMAKVRGYLLKKLPIVQALAVEVMPVSELGLHWSSPTPKKVGLESHGVGPKKQAKVDALLRQFAQTPSEMRHDLGSDNIERARAVLQGHWEQANRETINTPCSCGCGVVAIDVALRAAGACGIQALD